MTTPDASRCSPVAAEHHRPELLGVHQQEADAVVVDQPGQQVGPVPLDLLERHPAGQVGERHHRGVAGDDADHAGRHPRHLARPRRARARGRAATSWARSARSRSRRAIGPALSPRAAVTCQPSVVRRLSLGPVRCRCRDGRGRPAQPADQLLDRLPEPVGERPALGLAVVGEDDEVVRGAAPARWRGTAGRAAGRCCAAPRGCRRAPARRGGRPRRSRGSRRRRPGARPACPRAARRRRRRGR